MKDYKTIIQSAIEEHGKNIALLNEQLQRFEEDAAEAAGKAKAAAEAGDKKEFISCKNNEEYARIRRDAIQKKIEAAKAAPIIDNQDLDDMIRELSAEGQKRLQGLYQQFAEDYRAMRDHHEKAVADLGEIQLLLRMIETKLKQDIPVGVAAYSNSVGRYIAEGSALYYQAEKAL